MNRGLAFALAEEYRGVIDVIAQCPATMRTPMAKGYTSFDIVEPEDSVYGTLRALGSED